MKEEIEVLDKEEKIIENNEENLTESSEDKIENPEELLEQKQESEEKDTNELKRIRGDIERLKNESGGSQVKEVMAKEEKIEKVLGSGSFDDKFELLKELKEEKFEFEIKGLVNKLSQKMVDSSSTKEKREDFVGDIVKAIRKAHEEKRLPDDFFDGIDKIISVGSGHGENPFGILKEYMPKGKAILIDPDAAPSKAIAEDERVVHLGQRFEDVKIEVGPGEKNLVEASNFLQLYNYADKVEMVKKMITLAGVGGKIIIVDEIYRSMIGSAQDWALNKLYNPTQKKYKRLNPGEYEKMFEELGLKVFTSGKTDQYNRSSVLFTLEVTPEAMEKAIGE